MRASIRDMTSGTDAEARRGSLLGEAEAVAILPTTPARVTASTLPPASLQANRVTHAAMDWTRAAGLFAAILAACGDSGGGTTSSSTTTDAGTSGDVPTTSAGTTTDDGLAEWDQCTQITLEPPEVSQTAVVGIVPQAIGGTIADGVYVLTSYEVFGSAGLTSDSVSGALLFASPAYQLRTLNDTASGIFSTMGPDITLTAECTCSRVLGDCDMTVQMPGTQPYTFFDDTLLVFSDYINGGTVVATYKQQ